MNDIYDNDVLLVTMSFNVTVIKSESQLLFRLVGVLILNSKQKRKVSKPWHTPHSRNLACPDSIDM